MALNPSNSNNLEQLALKGLTLICQKIKTSRDLDHAHLGQFVITGLLRAVGKNPRTPRSVNRGPHICVWGASNSLPPALATKVIPRTKFPTKFSHKQSLRSLDLGLDKY